MANWCARPVGASPAVKNWLMDRGSLTARMRKRFSGFGVRGVQQCYVYPLPDELRLLGRARPALSRDVWLCDGETNLVCAHSVIPRSVLQGSWRKLKQLGGRPLGDVLFSDAQVKRSSMQYCRLPLRHPLFRRASMGDVTGRHAYWARRSLFVRNGRRILVTEVFLPSVLGD